MSDLDGNFETHLTVAPGSKIDNLQDWARAQGLKCTHIVLSKGATASQPMLTWHGSGSLQAQLDRARQIGQMLEDQAFSVTRVKVEVGLSSIEVPTTTEDASSLPEQSYFEFHVKLKLPSNADLTHLTQVALRNSAHLSRNAFCIREDGFQERFVTQRNRRVGKSGAIGDFEQLMNDLRLLNVDVLEVEQEFVVYDSNLQIDAGWLTGNE